MTMKDYIAIGCTPVFESCYQAGHPLAIAETRIFRDQLRRQFPGADLRVKGFPHDFGTYYEVCAYYDDSDEAAVDMAFTIEAGMPENWDDIARKELEVLKHDQ